MDIRAEKDARWEKGQAILHKDDKDKEKPAVTNTYGVLRYEKDKKSAKEGFIVEAKEAPGTPVHTYREKHLSLENMKRVKENDDRFLYSSEVPFRNQSFFCDVREENKSGELLDCMKRLLKEQRHGTLKDLFGFLDQDPERAEKQFLEKERLRSLTLEEFDIVNKRIDELNGRLCKKQAKERQLCSELQLIIDRKERRKNKESDSQKRMIFGQEKDIPGRDSENQDENMAAAEDEDVKKQDFPHRTKELQQKMFDKKKGGAGISKKRES